MASRFGKMNDLELPAFSAGWIISEEKLLKDNATLTFKIKGSWGKLEMPN
jgi:hypothetical protein